MFYKYLLKHPENNLYSIYFICNTAFSLLTNCQKRYIKHKLGFFSEFL